MKLTVIERITLLSVLPKEGDIVSLRIVRELRESLSFDEMETKALKLKHDEATGSVVWDSKCEEERGPKAIKIGEKATDIIVAALKELSGQRRLTEQHIPIYEMFIKE